MYFFMLSIYLVRAEGEPGESVDKICFDQFYLLLWALCLAISSLLSPKKFAALL